MFKVSATSVDASVQMCRCLRKLVIGLKTHPYENLNIFKSAE